MTSPLLWGPLGAPTDGLDPYLVWARASAFRGFGGEGDAGQPAPPLPVLIELHEGQQASALPAWVNVAPAYLVPVVPGGPLSRFVTGRIERSQADALAGLVKAFEIGLPRVPRALQADWWTQLGAVPARLWRAVTRLFAPAPVPPKVLVGVIDCGCGFLRDEFCRSEADGGTRIRALWDQDAAVGQAPASWEAPSGFSYGAQLASAGIDRLRQRARTEPAERLYRELGHFLDDADVSLPLVSHGTAVLGLAAATTDPTGRQAASDAQIVFVHVPRLTTRDTSGGALPVNLLDGVRFILAQADATTPVVINVSYGSQAGPHDGSSLIERALDELLDARPGLAIVVAAGNAAQSGCQGFVALAPGETRLLAVELQDDDMTDSFCEVWVSGPADSLELGLTSPAGLGGEGPDGELLMPAIRSGQAQALRLHGSGPAVAMVSAAPAVPIGRDGLVLLAFGPTAAGKGPRLEPGRWDLSLHHTGAEGTAGLICHAYVERDDRPAFGAPGGAQACFVAPPEPARAGSLSSIATGTLTTVVGGNRPLPDGGVQPCDFSGAGPSRNPNRPGPDVTAACNEVGEELLPVVPFLGEAGPQVRMGFTSAAAPVVTRWLAQQLARWDGALPSARQIQQMVRGDAPKSEVDPKSGFRPLPPDA